MATANFLEEALNTDVDESAVNAIVGSLETQLVTQSSQIYQNQSISVQSSAANLNFNGNLTYNNNSNNLNSTTLTTTTSQKNYALPNVTTFSTTSSANSAQLKTINNNNNNNSNTFASQYQQHLNTLSQQQNNNNNNHNIPNSPATIANTITSIRMPKNEPVKVAYPASSQQSSPAVLTMNNNRVTFTSAAPLQNGTITLSQLTSQQNQQQSAGSGGSVMQSNVTNIKLTGTSIAATGQPQQTLVFKNASSAAPVFTSSTPGIVTMSKTVNNQTTTPNLVTQLPSNLIVSVKANTQGQQSAQKVTNIGQQPRFMIPHNMIRNNPNSTISLQGIPAQPGSTLLLKGDNGQFQLLRIGPAPTAGTQITPGLTSTGNQTIRLQTLPGVSRFTGPPLALRKTIVTQQSITPHSSSTSTILVNPSTTTSTASQQQIISAQSTPIVSAVPALTSTQQSQQTSQQTVQQQQQQPNATTVVVTNTALQQPTQNANSGTTTVTGSGASVVVTQQQPIRNDNTKEKCRKFLTNLIELSKREPSNVEKNVRTLIQELVDANVEPEEFCKKLERLLNASPQPCLIGFLKKSLPLLRQSLVTKEIVIEGINPPSPTVAFSGATITTTQIPAQIRPIGQTVMSTGSIGQTQIRMVTPSPRIGQTTIRQTTPIRIQTAGTQITTPRLTSNLTPIRAGQTIVQTNTINQTQGIPALQPVSNTILSGTTQIRTPATITRPQTTVQIRQTTPVRPVSQTNQKNIILTSPNSVVGQKTQLTGINTSAGNAAANVVANATASIQLKQTATSNNIILNNNIVNSNNNNNNSNLNVNISNNSNLNKNNSQYIANSSSSTTATATQIVINSNKSNNKLLNSNSNNLPTVNSKSIAITSHVVSSSSSLHHTSISHSNATVHNNKTIHDKKSQNLSAGTIRQVREKQDKKFGASLNATGSLSSGSGGANVSAYYPTIYGDDDINDVAAMGGVNLAEESQRILGSTEYVGTQIRSCKDEVFLNLPALQQKIRACMAKHGLDEPSTDVAVLLSHATQEHLKNVVEKLAVIAEHRIDILKIDPRYEMTTDVRGQIKFLEELDKVEQKRHEEYEREMLLRAAKSRSKTEDPEQAKLKAKAKEMQRAEMEELRHREANNTALQAIGPRKRPKLDSDAISSATGTSGVNTSNKTTSVPRPRIKRVNLRDMIFYLEQEKDSNRNNMLYKAYLK